MLCIGIPLSTVLVSVESNRSDSHEPNLTSSLGSNTCVQDAFNLAWKLVSQRMSWLGPNPLPLEVVQVSDTQQAYVERNYADASLLDSFSEERQPIGAGVIERANQGLRE